jgi:accessory colonization factor AcfC
VRFTADIVTGSRISTVLIENLRFEDVAGKPGRFAYVLSLRENIKPAKPGSTSAVDADIAGNAKEIVGQLVNAVANQL